MSLHLRGMWVAFGVAAAFIVYFLLRVRRALERHERELDAARAAARARSGWRRWRRWRRARRTSCRRRCRRSRCIAGDLERDRRAAGRVAARAVDDARLMRAEVERCRAILERMAPTRVTRRAKGSRPCRSRRWSRARWAASPLRASPCARRSPPAVVDRLLTVPPRAVGQALSALIKNAQQASPPGDAVVLRVAPAGGHIRFEIRDRGAGMPAEVLARVGEPFFTTKPAGRGMGLGVFLARAVAERLGGELTIRRRPGRARRSCSRCPSRRRRRLPAQADGGRRDDASSRCCSSTTTRCSASGSRSALRQRGYEVVTAADCDEAVRAAGARQAGARRSSTCGCRA